MNKSFKLLIDANDQLWENAIKYEMLGLFERKNIQSVTFRQSLFLLDELPGFESKKTKLQYLLEQRQKQPWTIVTKMFACGLE